ncbi:YhgE/Pip domain-containing protein [Streptomyces lycii]|uniref:YhgE/Pip domain-containing protein n=1 Tax=Streptomyces lycii TaxID=2654337 RepID=A0ABQ7FNS0_9ACTN|nr:YhgE/Pip domain-containing protein [Streptomyces lycii]KAF4410576.1 YhgE/Pip domain-containing protein [Streptomyces lycii]
MRSPKLAALELKRFGRGRLPRAALAALLLLPLLYGALYLWSFWDPYGRLDKLPVALVNADRGATADGERITAGDTIAEGLRDSGVFDWHEVGAAEARDGVENGRYYLSLTVPADFSERVASSSGDSGGTPGTAALRVRTNDANNYVVGQISRTVFSEVRASASADTARSFLDRIFVSFSDIHGATEKAAKGADDLDEGIGKAHRGAGDLAEGLTEAKKGSGKLKKGLRTLDSRADDLEKGAGRVADGTGELADKAAKAAGVVPFLKENGDEIGRVSGVVADTAGTVRERLADLPSPTTADRLAEDSREAEDFLAADHEERCEGTLTPDAACPRLAKAAEAAGTAAGAAENVRALVRNEDGELDRLDRELGTVQTWARKLERKAPGLWKDVDAAVKKIDKLDEGAKKVAAGADAMHTGLTTAKDGATGLDTGVRTLSTGANGLDGGLVELVDGSGELAGGLHDGARKIPDYDERDRDARTEVMADPVRLAAESLHRAPNYGTGFAPYFVPLSLWVGAMVAYMLIRPLNRRALAAGASSWRVALAGWLPVAALGVLQTAALLSVLHWGLGLRPVRAAGTAGFLLLVTACFAALVQWLNARFGPAGRILVLALLMLQLTSAGGTYPVETSPGFFNAVHPFLPMTHVVEGLRRLVTGGGLGPVWQGCAVLTAHTLGALALTAWSARRQQVWTPARLHPELSL